MHKFMFMYAWITGCFSVCLLCCYQVFMALWVGPDLMISNNEMILFVLYYYILSMGDIRYTYHQAAGLYWNKRYYTIVEAVFNIILAILLVPKFGMIAVIISCALSCLLINFGYSSIILYKYYFKGEKIKTFYLSHLFYFCVNMIACIICYGICSLISCEGFVWLLVKLVIALLISNGLFLLIYRRNQQFIVSMEFVFRILKNILPAKAQNIAAIYIEKHAKLNE